MTYQSCTGGYVFWNDRIMIPFKRSPNQAKPSYFVKEVPFEEAPSYWEYICEDGSWNVYYVKRGVNRRLAQVNIGKFSPESILTRISDKDISVTDCRRIEERQSRQVDRTPIVGVIWSKDFDNRSVFELMEQWPKMPFAHIKMVIENEGGSIDSNGIIHRG